MKLGPIQVVAAALALAGTCTKRLVLAHEEADCQPVVQVTVRAPAAYKGAVDLCREEINDPAVCPDDFPSFPTCNDPAPNCQLAVIGAGTGGLYTALRMVDEGAMEASNICIFEMTERVGGRLMSLRGLGPEDNLVVDAGGYRTWPEYTPTAHALITEYLGIPMGCYDDSVPCQVYNIVDENGTKAGFTTFVEEMMQRLTDRGACFYPFHELRKLERVNNANVSDVVTASKQLGEANTTAVTRLHFANGVTATATMATILNIPQHPLLQIVRNSQLDNQGMLNRETLDALHSVQTVIATKLYLYYPRGSVWWRKLGLTMGDFEHPGDARNMLLAGRYHDGQVICDNEDDPDSCHGFLLAVYANDLSGNKAQFFRRYQRDRPEPVTILSETDLEGSEFLKHAHQQLMDYHLLYKQDAPYTGLQATEMLQNVKPPQFAMLSTWDSAIPWAGGGWHGWTEPSNIDLAQMPFVDHQIYLVNEAYSAVQAWAEGTIKLADEILEDYFGIARPWNFTVTEQNQIVRQTNSQECTAVATASGGDAGSAGEAAAAVLCFTGNAKVSMADGTYKPLQDVQVGDKILTGGPAGQVGIVTQALRHPVHKVVTLAKLVTEDHGELLGTEDHPVMQNDQWINFGRIMGKAKVQVQIVEQFVDTLYNLEVDGHLVDDDIDTKGKSLHAYIVNGVVASGLGDNVRLNLQYPRQTAWKLRAEQTRTSNMVG